MSPTASAAATLNVATRPALPIFVTPPASNVARPNRQKPLFIGAHVADATVAAASLGGYYAIAHVLGAARAAEAILGLRVPAAARHLRKLAGMAELLIVHGALLPGALSGPDGLPENTGAQGDLCASLSAFGADVARAIAAHGAARPWIATGGAALADAGFSLAELADRALSLRAALQDMLTAWQRDFDARAAHAQHVPARRTALIGLTEDDGTWSLDGERLRILDGGGAMLEYDVDADRFDDVIGTGLPTPVASMYYLPYGADDAQLLSGPLARINIAAGMPTPLADAALGAFRARYASNFRRKVLAPAFTQHARMIEALAALETIAELCERPLTGPLLDAPRMTVARELGIGAHEAPFGTVLHRYHVDAEGVIVDADLVSAA
jgi:coenzyme F420-reducing hydrogenase alpha subunit